MSGVSASPSPFLRHCQGSLSVGSLPASQEPLGDEISLSCCPALPPFPRERVGTCLTRLWDNCKTSDAQRLVCFQCLLPCSVTQKFPLSLKLHTYRGSCLPGYLNTDTHLGNLVGVLDSWIQLGPALAVVGIWRMYQWGRRSLSVFTLQINNS